MQPPEHPTHEALVRRVALIEINGRRANEAIERGFRGKARGAFVCECGHAGCNAMVEVALSDYEAVRTDFDRFIVAPGHDIDGVDEVVERHQDHLIVMKLGEGAELARQMDPRTDS
jgi:hypothetical protein